MSSTPLSTPPTQPSGPQLTPQFCFNTRFLRDFLRISRSQLDDTISTNLNALLTPARTSPFNPASTQSTTTNRINPRTPIAESTCTQFLENILFPAWANRTHVLSYCSLVAASPDPNDPDLAEIQSENSRAAQRKVDERLDPYSGRFFPREPRAEQLGILLRNENAVEGIVRARTWRTLQERCAGLSDYGNNWEDALDEWKRRTSQK